MLKERKKKEERPELKVNKNKYRRERWSLACEALHKIFCAFMTCKEFIGWCKILWHTTSSFKINST